jgi:hypothetical protein
VVKLLSNCDNGKVVVAFWNTFGTADTGFVTRTSLLVHAQTQSH